MLKRVVLSSKTPGWVALVNRSFSQKLFAGFLQFSHSLHWGIQHGMTWSPTATLVTFSPIDSTMPAPSWPNINGKISALGLSMLCKSEWQTFEFFFKVDFCIQIYKNWVCLNINYSCGNNFNSNFTSFWRRYIYGLNDQWLFCAIANGCFTFYNLLNFIIFEEREREHKIWISLHLLDLEMFQLMTFLVLVFFWKK